MSESPNAAHARRYLQALEDGVTTAALCEFFTPDIVQREHPNRFTPQGATRDLAALVAASERGRHAVADQRYAVRALVETGDTVAIEAAWSAVLKVPVGTLAAGDTMRAALAMFLTYRDGRICELRNYDCFAPF
ncbi:MAG: nuclear transport factor 2 family protein [Deltaproteobacteria bacterium]|nr:nuclear transport factor 2 family protein [Deltaproteobacteria bacterium]